jgi:hypothetical protein
MLRELLAISRVLAQNSQLVMDSWQFSICKLVHAIEQRYDFLCSHAYILLAKARFSSFKSGDCSVSLASPFSIRVLPIHFRTVQHLLLIATSPHFSGSPRIP